MSNPTGRSDELVGSAGTPALETRAVSKQYGGFRAVDAVDLTVAAGEVHSLVGANGAGKSTLLGMMSGRESSSSGEIFVFGRRLTTGRPRESRAAGISVVYQELTVLPNLSARANVFLGHERSWLGRLDERAMASRYAELAAELHVTIPGDVMARDLSVAAQQQLEIMRAVELDARILLLDEPTAALSHREREELLALVGHLRARGVTVVLVTHNLDEVLAVSDRITVMRNGRKVAEGPVSEWTKRTLVSAMTGTEQAVGGFGAKQPIADAEPLLVARNVAVSHRLAPVSFSLRAGEVLGIAGLVGAGRTTLLRAIAGAEPGAEGELVLGGEVHAMPKSPRAAQRLGIALLPENRKTEGLVLGMSIADNITLSDLGRVARFGVIDRARQQGDAAEQLKRFDFTKRATSKPVGSLSGGNQQKVVIGSLLYKQARVLVIDEPTRGIDVAAKTEVLREIRRIARELLVGVILTSTETEEVIDVSDRILVLSHGALAGELDYMTGPPTIKQILELAFGAEVPKEESR